MLGARLGQLSTWHGAAACNAVRSVACPGLPRNRMLLGLHQPFSPRRASTILKRLRASSAPASMSGVVCVDKGVKKILRQPRSFQGSSKPAWEARRARPFFYPWFNLGAARHQAMASFESAAIFRSTSPTSPCPCSGPGWKQRTIFAFERHGD